MKLETAVVVAVVASVLTLLMKIVFDWLKGRNDNNKDKHSCDIMPAECRATLTHISEAVDWTKEIHDSRDPDGLPLWFVPRELTKLARENSERTLIMNAHLKEIRDILRENQSLLRALGPG